MRQVTYSGTGMVIMAAFCYPRESVDIARAAFRSSRSAVNDAWSGFKGIKDNKNILQGRRQNFFSWGEGIFQAQVLKLTNFEVRIVERATQAKKFENFG